MSGALGRRQVEIAPVVRINDTHCHGIVKEENT
jgi:hypothetical protein